MNIAEISGTVIAGAAALVISLFALPSYVATLKQRGLVRALLIFIILGLITIGFGILAVKTGLPLGKFSYNDALGRKLFGATPWTVALAYPPILLGAFWLARKFGVKASLLLTPVFATVANLVLDPAMVKLAFWQWEKPGPYFGLPVINFAGWLICSFVGTIVLLALWGDKEVRRSAAYSLIGILLFWSGVNIGVKQWIPAAIGGVASCVLLTFFVIERLRDKKNQH